nr:hypothetical protein [Tanacetum cinerariifolium]
MAPLTFADTHNMIAFLTKSDVSEGFDQIVDFLNAHMIQYALMVNPTIYVSYIMQFWTFVSIKKSNDVVRLQALIDWKKVIITKDTITQALRLDDVASVDCLPNEESFAMLARMGYEKLGLSGMNLVLPWLQLSSALPQYTSPALTEKVFAKLRWIGKGFSGVDTPLFDGMLVQQQVQAVKDAVKDENDDNEVSAEPTPPSPTPATPPPSPTKEYIPSPPQAQTAQPSSPPSQKPSQTTDISQSTMTLLNTLLETCATLTKQVAKLKQDKIAQAIEITKLKQRVRRRMHLNREKFAELDADEDVTLVDAEEDMNANDINEAEPTEVKKVIEVVTAAKFMTKVVTTAATTTVDASEGFDQIVDFLNAHMIQYALMVNPAIYVSCIKQFLTSISIKKSNDVVRLQALIDRKKVFANMRRIGKGFSRVNTPLFDGMLVRQQVQAVKDAAEDEDDDNEDTDEAERVKIEKVIEVVTAAKLMTEVVTTAATTITIVQVPKASAPRRRRGVVIQDPEETATSSVIMHFEVKSKDKGNGILIEEPKPLKRQAKIKQDEAFARLLEAELNENINWDDVMEQVKGREKQDNTVMRYQALKRKPVTEAQARKNMMIYLKNMAGFKMHFFKGMTYNEIRPIFEKHYNLNQIFLERVEEEVIVNDDDDDDDVFTKATPLASKVPVVDYQIHHENNKPYYKIIKADGTHKLFISFITLLKNFDREDLEILWKLVQNRFQSSEPKNFSNDFLLNTLKIMFEKPNVEANI